MWSKLILLLYAPKMVYCHFQLSQSNLTFYETWIRVRWVKSNDKSDIDKAKTQLPSDSGNYFTHCSVVVIKSFLQYSATKILLHNRDNQNGCLRYCVCDLENKWSVSCCHMTRHTIKISTFRACLDGILVTAWRHRQTHIHYCPPGFHHSSRDSFVVDHNSFFMTNWSWIQPTSISPYFRVPEMFDIFYFVVIVSCTLSGSWTAAFKF